MTEPNGIDETTGDVTCSCGHIWELIIKYDNSTGQTDHVNPYCPECDKHVLD